MIFLEPNYSEGSYIFLAILAMIVSILLTLYLIRRVHLERLKIKEEQSLLLEGLLTKSELNSSITSYLSKITTDNEFYLLYLDLDKYLEIVNAFGQKPADKALEKIAHNITKVLPRRTQMARYKGDEFLIFLKTEYDKVQVLDLARKLLEVVKTPIKVFDETFINPTASIGICHFPNHGRTLKQLLNSLKIAVFIAKKNGGNNFLLYSDEMEEKAGKNIEYYYQIKNALKNNEFILYYQPIINQEEKSCYGVEALLRWNHPEQGILSPGQFIHIIEQSGDIYRVGLWGMETLIKEYFEIHKEFEKVNVKFSFNLSPKQLLTESLAMDFQRLLKKYKITAANVTFEISEFALFDKHEAVLSNISKLKEMGFQIAIDGFGLDYTTLERLEEMPLDIIKLDKEFLGKDETSVKNQFAALLVGFAKNNNKTIICEGIENEETLTKAVNYGIKLMQGYYFSKPITFSELRNYLRNENWKNL